MQILTKGTYTSPAEVAAVVDSITKNDVLTVRNNILVLLLSYVILRFFKLVVKAVSRH